MRVWVNGANGLVGKSLIEVSKGFQKIDLISSTRQI